MTRFAPILCHLVRHVPRRPRQIASAFGLKKPNSTRQDRTNVISRYFPPKYPLKILYVCPCSGRGALPPPNWTNENLPLRRVRSKANACVWKRFSQGSVMRGDCSRGRKRSTTRSFCTRICVWCRNNKTLHAHVRSIAIVICIQYHYIARFSLANIASAASCTQLCFTAILLIRSLFVLH